MAIKTYTDEQIIALLREAQGESTQTEFAQRIGVARQYLSDVMNRRRSPGPAIRKFLGLAMVTVKAEDKAA